MYNMKNMKQHNAVQPNNYWDNSRAFTQSAFISDCVEPTHVDTSEVISV